ncbi:MAG TPA: hypothetical protein VD766_01995 [Solirubrobacterales bacterium]|nr:hypothetical protein [Solirubrobacterales bacterium]
MRPRLTGLIATSFAVAGALGLFVAGPVSGERMEPSGGGAVAKPALATCFWEGPISTRRPSTRGFDGRTFNFPEESATYWLARVNLPEGSRLKVRGRYPYGRYMSLNSYSDGAPTDALSDVAIAPRPGSVNPFEAGARRDVPKRSWRVTVIDAPPPADAAGREPNTLYAEPAAGAAIELAYRVYEPDRGYGLTGGTDLPRAVLVLEDGTHLRGEEACAAVNDPNREITVQTIPEAVWETARATPGCDAETNPAYDPIRWERFFNVNYASLAVITDCTEAGRESRLAMNVESEGGFYSNRDSAYIFAHLSRNFGPVVVLRGRLPDFPQTVKGPDRMPEGELRFWSLCSGESRVTTRTPDCLADRQVLAQSGRTYTIVVSKREDRPANARAKCAVAWLDWGERGDGAGDPDYALLIMRNMLVDPDWDEAIQRVERPAEEAEVMKEHFPDSQYETVEEFEARGC